MEQFRISKLAVKHYFIIFRSFCEHLAVTFPDLTVSLCKSTGAVNLSIIFGLWLFWYRLSICFSLHCFNFLRSVVITVIIRTIAFYVIYKSRCISISKAWSLAFVLILLQHDYSLSNRCETELYQELLVLIARMTLVEILFAVLLALVFLLIYRDALWCSLYQYRANCVAFHLRCLIHLCL